MHSTPAELDHSHAALKTSGFAPEPARQIITPSVPSVPFVVTPLLDLRLLRVLRVSVVKILHSAIETRIPRCRPRNLHGMFPDDRA